MFLQWWKLDSRSGTFSVWSLHAHPVSALVLSSSLASSHSQKTDSCNPEYSKKLVLKMKKWMDATEEYKHARTCWLIFPSIHPSSVPVSLCSRGSKGLLELSPNVKRWKQGVPVHVRAMAVHHSPHTLCDEAREAWAKRENMETPHRKVPSLAIKLTAWQWGGSTVPTRCNWYFHFVRF